MERQTNRRETVVPVTFRFPSALAPSAQCVSLIGPFNNWNPRAHPLARTKNGWWATTVDLPLGRVVYCFDVDGATWLDPNDQGRTSNDWGSEFSIRNIEPISQPPSPLRSPKVPVQGGAQIFECSVEETAEAIILRPSGEVDLATVWAFRDALTTARARSIVVDMRGIEYMDSCGIHALADHAAACKMHGEALILIGPRRSVQKVIRMTKLDETIAVLASVEVALDLLRSRAKPPKQLRSNEGHPTVDRSIIAADNGGQ
jgi:anti-sigma B factor antagonist